MGLRIFIFRWDFCFKLDFKGLLLSHKPPIMISIEVTYTVKPEFVEQNKQNIHSFLADFRQLKHLKFLYNVFVKEDGVTFMHISMYDNEAIQNELLQVPSFVAFQKQRDEQGLAQYPQIFNINLIGSSLDVIKTPRKA